jgi:glutaredoxin
MWVIFGKLISLQIKRWMLASRGYVEVEHISPTNVRNYFILRPKDSKFDMSSGFFHYIPECLNRKGQILKKFDKELLNKSNPEIDPKEVEGLSDSEREEYVKRLTAEWIELKNVYKVIVDRKYDPELLTRKMGMPVITYYGDNPDPINFSDRKKVYGSGVIKDMYLRLLLTQRYKDFRMFAIIVTVSLVIVAVCVVGLYSLHNSDVKNFARCVTLFNQTSSQYVAILNQTIQANIQSSGGVVTI